MIEAKLDGPYQYYGGKDVGWIVGMIVKGATLHQGTDRLLVLMIHGVNGNRVWVPAGELKRYPQGQIEQPTK